MLRIIRDAVELEMLQLPIRGVDTNVIINGVSVTQNIRVEPRSIYTGKPFIRTFSQARKGSPDDLILLGVLKPISSLKPGDVVYGLRKDIESRFNANSQRRNYFRSVELVDKSLDIHQFPYEALETYAVHKHLLHGITPSIVEETASSINYRGIDIVTSLAGVYIGSLLYKDLAEAKLAIDHSLYIVGLINE